MTHRPSMLFFEQQAESESRHSIASHFQQMQQQPIMDLIDPNEHDVSYISS